MPAFKSSHYTRGKQKKIIFLSGKNLEQIPVALFNVIIRSIYIVASAPVICLLMYNNYMTIILRLSQTIPFHKRRSSSTERMTDPFRSSEPTCTCIYTVYSLRIFEEKVFSLVINKR